jgi:hypothetical protein
MSHMQLNFQLMQHHKYSLSDIESMLPWERDIYVDQLRQYLEEENLKMMQDKINITSTRRR